MKHLSLQFIDGSVLWLLALLAGIALPLWYFRRLRRVTAVLLTAAALLLVVGIPAWRDSLASMASTPRALAIMTFASAIALITFGVHIHSARQHKEEIRHPETGERVPNPAEPHEDHYHHRWTVLLGIIGGTLAGLTLLDIPNVLKNLSKAPGGTGSALRDAQHQVTTGRAAQLAHHGGLPPLVILAIGAVILLGLYKAMGRHRHVQDDVAAAAAARQARMADRRAIAAPPRGAGSRRGPGRAAIDNGPQGYPGEVARRN